MQVKKFPVHCQQLILYKTEWNPDFCWYKQGTMGTEKLILGWGECCPLKGCEISEVTEERGGKAWANARRHERTWNGQGFRQEITEWKGRWGAETADRQMEPSGDPLKEGGCQLLVLSGRILFSQVPEDREGMSTQHVNEMLGSSLSWGGGLARVSWVEGTNQGGRWWRGSSQGPAPKPSALEMVV